MLVGIDSLIGLLPADFNNIQDSTTFTRVGNQTCDIDSNHVPKKMVLLTLKLINIKRHQGIG